MGAWTPARQRDLQRDEGGTMTTKYVLAQLNIARMKAPLHSRLMADFVANLDRINALAESAPGYVWRLEDESANATGLRPFGHDCIVNMSLWSDMASLADFAFRSGHVEIMRRRREWFDAMEEAYAVLWWVPHDHRPDPSEARKRLEHLRVHGPSAHAFTFKSPFPPPTGASD
jgi:hypothetical protein